MRKFDVNFKKPSPKQLNSLAKYYQTGLYENAEKLSLSITKEFPEHQFAWKVLGAVLKETGRISEALTTCQKSVQLDPQDSEAHKNLGVILQEQGRLNEAELSYRKSIALKPDYAEAHINLANTLNGQGKLNEAELSYRKSIALKPDYAEAHNNLGVMLQKELRRLNEAELSYRRSIALKPDYAKAHNNLGVILQEQGRLNEAELCYRKSIALKPDYAEAYRNLVLIKRFDSQNELYLKIQKLHLNENISKQQLCHTNFALAKICEDSEDFKQAFNHYREGNELRKKLLNYDISEDIEMFNQLKTNYLQIKQNSLKSKSFTNKLMPIFIVGMFRSGTTLVEQIISSHSEVTGAGELSFVREFGEAIARGLSNPNTDALLEFREKYLIKLKNFSYGNLIITDKMPQNFLFIGLLAATFPEAKIVHVKRNPAAVCWSNYKNYFVSKHLGYCYDLDNTIKYYGLYKNLMEFWAKQLPDRIYDADYELLTANQENETHQLIDYLGLNWDDRCLFPQNNMRSVATASNIQIRKKIYQGSSQQWEKYKPFLNGALDGF
jgi:Flp pilus assembly protein TadD